MAVATANVAKYPLTATPVFNALHTIHRLPPIIIGICGDSGSGKSTIVERLKSAGFQEVVLHTTRDMRIGELPGRDYYFTSIDEFIRSTQKNDFIGVDRVGNALYGIRKSTLLAMLQPGFKGIFAAGPNTIAGVRATLPQGIKFGSIFVNCSPETLERRIINRGRESGDQLTERINRIRGTVARYAPRLPEFDLIVSNDKEGEIALATAQIIDFCHQIENGQIETKRVIPRAYKMTPVRRVVQWEFDQQLFPKALETFKSALASPEPVDALAERMKQSLAPALSNFLEAMMMDLQQVTALPPDANKLLSTNLIPHISNAFLASVQIFHPEDVLRQSPKRVGRLFEAGDTERAMTTLHAIRAAAQTIPETERVLIILMHDIGKLIQFNNHSEISARLANDYNLLEFIKLTREEKKMLTLLVKYHQNMGDCAYGFMSWHTAMHDMFEDPEARQLFCNPDDSVNLDAIAGFLNRHRFMFACDTAGSLSEKGGLRNINLGLIYMLIEKISNAFLQNSQSYDKAIEQLLALRGEIPKIQLSCMLLGFDPKADTMAAGWQHYWDLISRSKDRAIAEGRFTFEEWNRFLEDFIFIDNKYCPHLWWMYFGPKPTKEDSPAYYKTPDEPPASIWNAYIIVDRIVRQVVPNFGIDTKVVLTYYDRDGKELAGREKEYLAAWEEHQIFNRAKGYKVEGDAIHFTDETGAILHGLTAKIIPGDKQYNIRFDHNNLHIEEKSYAF